MRYLLDTHAVHAAADPGAAKPLSTEARRVIESSRPSDLAISAITLVELARHIRNRVIETPEPARWLMQIERFVTVVPIDARLAYHATLMPWRRKDGREHSDPADRLIVATAALHRLKIIGNDAEMRHIAASHGFSMVW